MYVYNEYAQRRSHTAIQKKNLGEFINNKLN